MPAKSTKTPEQEEPEDEFDRVIRWRFNTLLNLGLTPDQAIALIETPDVGHAAQNLAELGCPPDLIVRILGGD